MSEIEDLRDEAEALLRRVYSAKVNRIAEKLTVPTIRACEGCDCESCRTAVKGFFCRAISAAKHTEEA